MIRSRLRAGVVVAVIALGAAGAGQVIANGSGGPTAKRHALAKTSRVVGARGRTMVLSKVVIPPGVKLALHRHRGTQIAYIHSGVLRYTVKRGRAPVYRGDADESPKLVRWIRAGQTATLRAGQWLVEQPTDIHRAANRGRRRVVVYLSTLLKKGAPPSTPVG